MARNLPGALAAWAAALFACLSPISAADGQPALPAFPGAETASAPGSKLLVLSEAGAWRAFYTWRTPRVVRGSDLKEATDGWGYDAAVVKTPPPPEQWARPDFPDGGWIRWRIGPERRKRKEFDFGFRSAGAPGPALAELCLRGRFRVEEPADVRGLTLSLSYRGGVVVYLNGKELARGHLPKGVKLTPESMADEYPPEAFVKADRKPIRVNHGDPRRNRDRLAKRIRTLPSIKIQPRQLRRGVNVLALELHRSAYFGSGLEREGLNCRSVWSTCGLVGLELRAEAGVTPNITRPAGVQVWVSSPMARTRPWQWSDPLEGPGPMVITGCRNGRFTGKVVVSSEAVLKGVRATVGELRHKDGEQVIPASQVRVLYSIRDDRMLMRYRLAGGFWDTLLETPPPEVGVSTVPAAGGGAVQPIIVKIRVGPRAAPGDYEGKLTVAAVGTGPVEIPVTLRVVDWKLPDPRDYGTLMGLVQSPDSVAMYYKVPLWSAEHWRYMEKSFELLGEIGNNYVCIPLLARTNFGNEQSMLRWTANGDQYKSDFSIFDRYLDMARKHMNVRVVFLYFWERYMDASRWAGKGDAKGLGAKVTLVDPATGKAEVMEIPRLATPEGQAFWRSAWREILARMEKRGLREATMMGTNGDAYGPTKEMLAVYARIAPNVKWVTSSHADVGDWWRGMRVGYNTRVYNSPFPAPGQADRRKAKDGRYYGWTTHRNLFPREGCTPSLHHSVSPGEHRFFVEAALLSNNSGLGRTGADFWPLLARKSTRNRGRWNDKRSVTLTARYPETGWDQLNMDTASEAMLAPGPNGAVSTERFEQLREGVQECQARICIEKAILSGRLDADMVSRCWQVLDERAWRIRGAHIGWRPDYLEAVDSFGSAEKLYRMAAAVTRALGPK